MKKLIFPSLLFVVMATGLFLGCGGQSTPSPSQSSSPSPLSESSTPPRVNPGEILYTGRAYSAAFEDAGYFEGYAVSKENGRFVVDISVGGIAASFVLSEDRKEIRDVVIEVTDMSYTLVRPGQERKVDIRKSSKSYYQTVNVLQGETRLVLEEMQIGGECYLTLEFDGDTAKGHLRFINEYNWDNDIFPVDLGTRNISFTPEG